MRMRMMEMIDEPDSDWSWSVLRGQGSAAAAYGVINKGRNLR